MTNINQAGSQTVTSMKQAETAAKNLNDLAKSLNDIVNRFKLDVKKRDD
jgi:methyl-accepting chemotaxis protein